MADTENVLRDVLREIATEQQYENHEIDIQPMSSDGANYSSTLYLATLSAPNKENIDLFAKVASIGETMRSQMPLDICYKHERDFYTDILKQFQKLEEKHGIADEHRLLVPKFYGAGSIVTKETIVLENMAIKGFSCYDRFKSVDWEYASKAVEALSKWHALAISFSQEHPEAFAKLISEQKFLFVSDDNFKQFAPMWQAMGEMALKVVKEEYRENVQNYLFGSLSFESMKQFYEPSRLPVLAHGDYRPSNLMHKVNDKGEMQIAIIDFQNIHAGCPLLDLMYFVFTGSDEKFRKQYYQQLIDHYYTQLCLAMRRLHLDPQKIYPKEDFDYEYKQMLPFGLIIAFSTLQLVTDAGQGPKNIEGFEDFFGPTSNLYAERLNGIISDYIKWGVL